MIPTEDISGLIACPRCDALYRAKVPPKGERAVCARCHAVLAAPRKRAGTGIIALAVAVVILVGAAAFLPFLSIRVAGLGNDVSIFDAVRVFTGGRLAVLAIAMAALVLIIPVLRALLVIYVLVPIVLDRPPAQHARAAFRLSERLRPWSMAEIFAIGCAVALVKLTDLANVDFGPAFWMFAGVVVVIVFQDRFMCSWSVWNALDPKNRA